MRITDIWVDSPASMRGGRALWAIPKGLADFDRDSAHTGPLERTSWTATVGRSPLAEASYADLARIGPRLPYRAGIDQPALPDNLDGLAGIDGESRTATFGGTARMLPARASWSFPADSPLAWLARARPRGSIRMSAFRMTFG